VLLVGGALAAALTFVPAPDGRPLGAALLRSIVCAARGDCAAQARELARAYGESDARLVRGNAPNVVYEGGTLTLPVDYRQCRSHRCSDAPDRRGADVHRATRGGAPATAFTHVVKRGESTYVQYWLYYPDSTSTLLGKGMKLLHLRSVLGTHPYHRDDWEGYQIRIRANGRTEVRATAHGRYQWCKHLWCNSAVCRIAKPLHCPGAWGPTTGWTRVSRGSHAGHIPKRARDERYTSAPALRLVPLERVDPKSYRPLPGGVDPPWTKKVWRDPESGSS
jgi:hypothetical protein